MTGLKILFGPVITAGNLTVLSSILRTRGHETLVIDYFPNYLKYPSDVAYAGPIQQIRPFAERCVEHAQEADIIVLDFLCSFLDLPMFGVKLCDRYYEDVERLRALGKPVFMCVWGSDVRSQSHLHYYHLRYSGVDSPYPPQQLPAQRERVQRLDELGVIWLGHKHFRDVIPRSVPFWETGIVMDDWSPRPAKPAFEGVIVTGSTDRRKKNIGIVESGVAQAGHKLTILEGIPHSQMAEAVRDADIAFPQVSESYGLFAVEMMAMNIPVVCGYDPRFPTHRDEAPIHRVGSFQEIGPALEAASQVANANSRDFVAEYHDMDKIADHLVRYIEQALDGDVEQVEFPEWRTPPTDFSYYDVSIPYFLETGATTRARIEITEALAFGYEVRQYAHLLTP